MAYCDLCKKEFELKKKLIQSIDGSRFIEMSGHKIGFNLNNEMYYDFPHNICGYTTRRFSYTREELGLIAGVDYGVDFIWNKNKDSHFKTQV